MSTDFDTRNIASVANDPATAAAALTSVTSEMRRLRRANEMQREQMEAYVLEAQSIRAERDLLSARNAELAHHLEQAAEIIRRPVELVLGHGMVGISGGKLDGKAVMLFEPLDSPEAPLTDVGLRKPESFKPGSALLVLDGPLGMAAIVKAVELSYRSATGAASPHQALWDVCRTFIDDHRVSCAEATYEDRVYEDAPDLVEAIAKFIGYYKYPDEDEQEEDEV